MGKKYKLRFSQILPYYRGSCKAAYVHLQLFYVISAGIDPYGDRHDDLVAGS